MSAVYPVTDAGQSGASTSADARAGLGQPRDHARCEGALARWRPVSGVFRDLPGSAPDRTALQRKDCSHWTMLISLCTLATLLGLYNLRSLDDNHLTSWWWVFHGVTPVTFFLMVVAGMALAYGISRLSWRGRWPVPLAITAAFCVTAGLWQGPEVIVDAARHFMQAKYLEPHGIGYFLTEWGNAIPAWTDLPLAPLIYGALFQAFGESRLAVQVLTSLLFSATVGLTYLIGKTLWSRELGLYAGILLLGMPYLLAQVPLMMVDVAAMFFLTLAVFTSIVAISRGGAVPCILAAIAISLAMLAKYSNWLMLSIVPVIVLSHVQPHWKPVCRRAVAVVAGVMLLMGMFIYAKFDVVAGQIGLLQSFQLPALGRWGESLLSTFFYQIHPVVTVLAILSAVLAIRNKDIKYAIICWMLVVVMLLELRRIRYMLVILPMLALMAAYGLQLLRRVEYRKFITASVAVTAILIVTVGYLPFFKQMSANNIRQAGAYLDSITAGPTEVYVLPQARSSVNPAVAVPMLDLFTRQPLVFHAGTGTAHATQGDARLPWRWTWEVTSTGYLPAVGSTARTSTIVVIHSEADQSLPEYLARRMEGYQLQNEFLGASGVFRFRTLVSIYERV